MQEQNLHDSYFRCFLFIAGSFDLLDMTRQNPFSERHYRWDSAVQRMKSMSHSDGKVILQFNVMKSRVCAKWRQKDRHEISHGHYETQTSHYSIHQMLYWTHLSCSICLCLCLGFMMLWLLVLFWSRQWLIRLISCKHKGAYQMAHYPP